MKIYIFPIFVPLFFWLLLFVFLWKIPLAQNMARKKGPTKRPDSAGTRPVSIIIPARNEEKNLKSLLDSLRRQSVRPLEIIVVNDGSEDGTCRVSLEKGVFLINLPKLPPGWTGKAFACFQGAKAASGDLLIFLDADTVFERDGLETVLNLFEKKGGFVSIQPFHLMKQPYEKLSAFFNLILFLNMNISSCLRRLNQPRGAFGPCFICRKSDYFALGGHEAVKREVIEDMALGQLAQKMGYKVHCFAGKGVISFRMYPGGLGQLIEGWTKKFAAGAVKSGLLLFLISFGWIAGAISGPTNFLKGIITGNSFLWKSGSVLYFLYSSQIYFFLRQLGNFGIFSAIFYPFNLVFSSSFF